MTHRDGVSQGFRPGARGAAMRDIGSRAPRLKAMGSPKALGSRRSGHAGEPAAGESVGASASLDDVPQDPRLPSYPPVGPSDRLPDLYGSLSTLLGIRPLLCPRRSMRRSTSEPAASVSQARPALPLAGPPRPGQRLRPSYPISPAGQRQLYAPC